MIHFNYKGNKYTLFFYPCNCYFRITKGDRTREVKYDNTCTIKDFIKLLDKLF